MTFNMADKGYDATKLTTELYGALLKKANVIDINIDPDLPTTYQGGSTLDLKAPGSQKDKRLAVQTYWGQCYAADKKNAKYRCCCPTHFYNKNDRSDFTVSVNGKKVTKNSDITFSANYSNYVSDDVFKKLQEMNPGIKLQQYGCQLQMQ